MFLSLAAFMHLKGIDHLDTAVIDEDLIGGALVEEADGDQHISSMTTFELAQVRHLGAVCPQNFGSMVCDARMYLVHDLSAQHQLHTKTASKLLEAIRSRTFPRVYKPHLLT